MLRSQTIALPLTLLLLFGWFSNTNAQKWVKQEDRSRPLLSYEEAKESYDAWVAVRVPERSDGYKPISRALWFAKSRLDDAGNFNPSLLWKVWEESERLESFSTDGTEFKMYEWQSLGPKYSREFYSGGMGRINAIAQVPGDTNTIYIGSASGGVWVTHDGGEDWKVLTDNLPVLGTADILIHPEHHDVVYVATGDPDSNVPTIYSAGILKSTDGGETWDTTGFGPSRPLNTIKELVMHPLHSERLYAATTIGLWTTEDSGDSWRKLSSKPFRDLDVSSDGNLWYGTVAAQGVWRSTDDGDTWTMCSLPGLGGDLGRFEVAISPTETNVAYVAGSDDNDTFIGLWRTEDSGETWTLQSTTPNIFHWGIFANIPGGQTGYNLAMAVDPEDSDHLFVGSVNLYTSHDAGVTWDVSASSVPLRRGGQMHADIHALKFYNGRFYAGHDGGISIGVLYDDEVEEGAFRRIVDWKDISGGLVITQVHRLGLSQQGLEPELIVTGNQDNGINMLRASEWLFAKGGDGMECSVDPNDFNLMYAEGASGNLFRTVDGGQKWYGANDGMQGEVGAWVAPFELHPDSSGILWRGTSRIFISRDSAQTWQALTGELDGKLLSVMAVSPLDPKLQAAAAYNGDVHYTTDGWITHQTIPSPGRQIQSLTFSPDSITSKLLYVTVAGFRKDMGVASWNLGRSSQWKNLSTGLPAVPVNDLFIHPLAMNYFFAATDMGVYASNDKGESWHHYGRGLPHVIVTELNWHARSNELVISTYGRGIWKIPANPIKGYKLPALNLTAAKPEDPMQIELKWDPPTQRTDLLGYQIRWIGHARVRQPAIESYRFTASKYGTYRFAVDAVYPNGLSVATDTVSVRLIKPNPAPNDVIAFVKEDEGSANIVWYPPVNAQRMFELKHFSGPPDGFRLTGYGMAALFPVQTDVLVQAITIHVRSVGNTPANTGMAWHLDLTEEVSPSIKGIRIGEGFIKTGAATGAGWVTQSLNRVVKGGPDRYLRLIIPVFMTIYYEVGMDSVDAPGYVFQRTYSAPEFTWSMIRNEVPMAKIICTPLASVEEDSSSYETESVGPQEFTTVRGSTGTSPSLSNEDNYQRYEIRKNGKVIHSTIRTEFQQQFGSAGYDGYQVRAVYEEGYSKWVDAEVVKISSQGEHLLTHDLIPGNLPQRYSLSAVYPNPFNHMARATLNLPKPTEVSMLVYNVRGDLVTRTDYGTLGAGSRTLTWHAQQVASGTYLIEVRAGEFREAKKVMLIR